MPVKRCQEDGKPGYKCGDAGKCYTYTPGDENGRKAAKESAVKQCIAIDEDPEVSVTAAGAGSTVDALNRNLRRAAKRSLELEERMVDVLVPVLEEAGRVAAGAFRQRVTNHLTAAAERRRADRRALGTLPIGAAREVVASLALTAAVDVQPTSTMVCVKPRPEEAEAIVDPDGGTPAEYLHVTLAYLGEIEGDLAPVLEALRPVAAAHAPLTGVVGGYGQFGMPDGSAVGILLPDVPGLVELRVAVTEALVRAGIDYARNHGFEAHLTVDGEPEPGELEKMLPLSGSPLHFDDLYLVRGDVEVHPLPLVGVPALTAAARGRGYCLPAALRGKMDPVRQAMVRTVMTDALNSVGLSFDVTNPLTARVLAQSGSQVVEISRTTQLDVMRAIKDAYEQGYSIPDTAKLIRSRMKDTAATRARLIARTELAGAVNGGSLAAARIVADATGETFYKEWMTAAGAKHPRHNLYPGLNGQTRPLDGHFDVGGSALEHPGDPSGPPEEVCNCRCAVAYTDDPGALTLSASAAPPAGVSAAAEIATLERELAALTAAAERPGWTPPAASEILDVDCGDVPHVPAGVRPTSELSPVQVSLRDADDRQRIETALDAIGSVHRVPADLRSVKVKANKNAGAFYYDQDQLEIRGAFWEDEDMATFVHEFGHYLDFSLFGSGREFATDVRSRELLPLFKAIQSTRAYKALKEPGGGGTIRAGEKYLRKSDELFARAYEQWVATSTGNPAMRSYIAKYRAAGARNAYWDDDDFEPIAAELEALFRARGLID